MPLLAEKIRVLDQPGGGPLYRRLEDALRTALRDQVLKPNEALPPERDLAADLSVSRITLRKALDLQPNLIEAQRRLIALRNEQGRMAEAVTLARTVQKQRPTEAIGFLLEGDARMAGKDAASALTAMAVL